MHILKEINLDLNENDIIDKKIDEFYTDLLNKNGKFFFFLKKYCKQRIL